MYDVHRYICVYITILYTYVYVNVLQPHNEEETYDEESKEINIHNKRENMKMAKKRGPQVNQQELISMTGRFHHLGPQEVTSPTGHFLLACLVTSCFLHGHFLFPSHVPFSLPFQPSLFVLFS